MLKIVHLNSQEKKKKKRKRKQVQDLRFDAEALEQSGGRLKRKERKKKYLEAKKNKSKKGKKEDNVDDFPGREKIRFGEVVQALQSWLLPRHLRLYKMRPRSGFESMLLRHTGNGKNGTPDQGVSSLIF